MQLWFTNMRLGFKTQYHCSWNRMGPAFWQGGGVFEGGKNLWMFLICTTPNPLLHQALNENDHEG